MAAGLTSWINQAMDSLKEWAGLGCLTALLVLASLMGLWCICKIRITQRREVVLIAQAFTAIEDGHSPQAWLAALKA